MVFPIRGNIKLSKKNQNKISILFKIIFYTQNNYYMIWTKPCTDIFIHYSFFHSSKYLEFKVDRISLRDWKRTKNNLPVRSGDPDFNELKWLPAFDHKGLKGKYTEFVNLPSSRPYSIWIGTAGIAPVSIEATTSFEMWPQTLSDLKQRAAFLISCSQEYRGIRFAGAGMH